MRVRAKSFLESVRDVRASGPFLGVRCAITLLHTFSDKIARKCYFFKLRLGAQSVTLLSTLRDPTQLRQLKFLWLIRGKE